MDRLKDNIRLVLVTGATGLQGGAVTSKLMASGIPVRALVRDLQSPASIRLSILGAELARGVLKIGIVCLLPCPVQPEYSPFNFHRPIQMTRKAKYGRARHW
jgi:uncharacterized protein YbjT (DUF2867 family)